MQKTPSLPPLSWRATAILILALLVRFIPMGRYVTPDEPIWVLRSVRFADALAARDWAAIPQTGHGRYLRVPKSKNSTKTNTHV